MANDPDTQAPATCAEATEVAAEVRRLLEDGLYLEVGSDDQDLYTDGLLDSLGIVELLLLLEQRFGVSIEPDSLDVDCFRSVASISSFVERATTVEHARRG